MDVEMATTSKRPAEEMQNEVGKKRKITKLTEETKVKALEYIYELFVHATRGNLTTKSVYGVMKYYHVAYKIHQFGRQFRNKPEPDGGTRFKKIIESGISIAVPIEDNADNVVKFTTEEVKVIIAGLENRFTKEAMYGDYHSIVCLLELFHERSKELQLGPNHWVTGRDSAGQPRVVNVSELGVQNEFRHFLSGLSWDENLRSTLAHSTSGLAQALLLSTSNNIKYSTKNRVAVERAYGFLPQIPGIAGFLQNNDPKTNELIIKRLAKLSALHGDKHKRRISLSFDLVLSCITKIINEKVVFDPEGARKISFTSKKGILLYNSSKLERTGGLHALLPEWYFHCTFGTHGEDFGILEYMTGRRGWSTRSEFKTFFKSIKTPTVSKFTIIKIARYSKSIESSMTNLINGGNRVHGALQMFSGFRKKTFDEAFMDCVKDSLPSRGIAQMNLNNILNHLDGFLDNMVRKIERLPDATKFGTVRWRSVEGATYVKGEDGTPLEDVPNEKGMCFWSNPEQ